MDRAMTERRRAPRSTGAQLRDLTACIRPGLVVSFVDVSRSGARVDGPRPLAPGAHVDIQVVHRGRRTTVAARVVRCAVAAIDPERGVTYRSALHFDDVFDAAFWELTAQLAHELPEARSANGLDCVANLPTAFASAPVASEER